MTFWRAGLEAAARAVRANVTRATRGATQGTFARSRRANVTSATRGATPGTFARSAKPQRASARRSMVTNLVANGHTYADRSYPRRSTK